jgi:hypothetical protein
MARLTGNIAAFFVQTGSPVAFTNEATTTSDRLTYRISNRAKRYFDRNTSIVVRVNGNVITSGYTVNYLLGAVTFSTQMATTDTVTISGAYIPVAEVGQGYEWSLEISANEVDATDFSSADFKSSVIIDKEATAKFSWWWGDEAFFNALNSQSSVIISLFTDDTTSLARYDCYAIPVASSVNADANELITEEIEFKVLELIYVDGGL